MSQPIIKIDNLNFYYDYKTPTQSLALKNINMEIGQGQYVVFFGPSGCGKTTLIYLIAGITTEKSGTGSIEVDGHDVLNFTKDELAVFRQTGIGIIFQQFNLVPSLNVLDNVALPMTFIGVPQKERREAAHKILKRLEMDQYAFRFPSELSGGQQQRVGIARSLANNPPIIIADEPLGNLDSENAEHVLRFLKELQEKDGRTIIMVTHEAWSVRDANKIIYMKDGTVTRIEENVKKLAGTVSERMEEDAENASIFPVTPKLSKELTHDLTLIGGMISALSNLLLRGFSADEIKRFESFLGERLAGHIDAAAFENSLDRPYRDGGVGLWKQRARKIATLTEDLLTHKQKLAATYATLADNPAASVAMEVSMLRAWILAEYTGHVTNDQLVRLDECIEDRLRNDSSAEDFQKVINLARSQGGVGFPIRTTHNLSDRLESVLALGHMKDYEEIPEIIASTVRT
jgi:putative ABC transport system ATP-binding protein